MQAAYRPSGVVLDLSWTLGGLCRIADYENHYESQSDRSLAVLEQCSDKTVAMHLQQTSRGEPSNDRRCRLLCLLLNFDLLRRSNAFSIPDNTEISMAVLDSTALIIEVITVQGVE